MVDGQAVDVSMLSRVAAVIQGFIDSDGESSVDRLIDEARPENSPIHDAFEWDDQVCGVEYRKIQSRHWHRAVRVEVTQGSTRTITTTMIHVPPATGNGSGVYIPAALLAKRGKEEEFQRALKYALGQAASNMKMLNDLIELAPSASRAEAVSQAKHFAESMHAALELVR